MVVMLFEYFYCNQHFVKPHIFSCVYCMIMLPTNSCLQQRKMEALFVGPYWKPLCLLEKPSVTVDSSQTTVNALVFAAQNNERRKIKCIKSVQTHEKQTVSSLILSKVGH